MDDAITDFGRAYRDHLNVQLPSASGPRALLKARLSELASRQPRMGWKQIFRLDRVLLRRVYLAGVVAVAVAVLLFWPSAPASLAWSPNPQLTPGVTVPVTEADVCSSSRPKSHTVLAALGKRVFEEYGIHDPEPRHYEMDYLIDPDLGGADDPRNLWPQPYSVLWNANVKDALEERLRELVCTSQITLAQAQRDIAMDWVAAYKRYFHTDRPLAIHQSFRKDQPWE
jgi:hypothetical protein